jgi:S-DNA-T family DNA segregation ATPase FtsK/SpoIIIE
MSEQKNENDKDIITRLALIIGVMGGFFGGLIWKGARQKSTWTFARIKAWFFYSMTVTFFVLAHHLNIPFFIDSLSWIFPKGLGEWVYFNVPRGMQFTILVVMPFLGWLASIGTRLMIRVHRFQLALDHLNMKSPKGAQPKVIDVVTLTPGLKQINISAMGFDVSEVRSKKVILESYLNLFVQDIRICESNRGIIEIRVSDKELPKLIPFGDLTQHLSEPYSFLVGEGLGGFIVGNLRKVNHLLVAGASGGGKSFFVKQLLIGLLKSSEHVQLYLLDLKKGVEVKVFERLENVFIAKNSVSAIETLDAVVTEMDRRFEYLEKHGYTEMDSKRDHMDRIVVLVDEASELFTLVRSSKAVRASAESARDLADKIAKLGRVAGIHLILATQKVVKETIDTRVQTNINARMIFRVNTAAGSMTVLGNKMAADLPEIQGRGIWSVGSQDLIVQTPKLDNEEVASEVTELLHKFNGDTKPLFQKMLIEKPAVKTNEAEGKSASASANEINAEEGAF